MKKIDHRKEMKRWYQPTAQGVAEVDPPKANYLAIDGTGDPNTAPEYTEAVEALFAVSYTIKFMVKKSALAIDYRVMPLEGLWWADDMAKFSPADKSGWKWTMMILQPKVVTPALFRIGVAEVRRKKNLAALDQMRFESLAEGRCAQILHVGPFSAEGPTVEKVHRYISGRGGRLAGKHHEIYLSDIRRAAPAKWRTIIRQPFVMS